MDADNIRETLCFLNNPILEFNMAPVPVVTQRRERELAWCYLTAVVNSIVAEARAKLVGVSFKAFGDGGRAAIVAKEGGGGGAVVIRYRVLGGFNWEWRISRIDAEGLDDALAGVKVCFPGGAFGLIRGEWGGTGSGARPIAGRGRSNCLGCYLDAHVSGASVGVHGIKSTWVPTVEVAQVAVNWLWIY
jgi:hypothetical protein